MGFFFADAAQESRNRPHKKLLRDGCVQTVCHIIIKNKIEYGFLIEKCNKNTFFFFEVLLIVLCTQFI